MSYIQEKKAIINKLMQPILKKYKVKATLSVENKRTINLNIKSSAFDFVGIYNKHLASENPRLLPPAKFLTLNYNSIKDNHFNGVELDFIKEAFSALQGAGYYDNSDAQVDYFNVAYYSYINIGSWEKPYKLID